MLTQEQLEGDVDTDGTVPSYQGVETDYARCEAIASVDIGDGGYVSVIADYQDRFIETRIDYATLIRNGWTFTGKPSEGTPA